MRLAVLDGERDGHRRWLSSLPCPCGGHRPLSVLPTEKCPLCFDPLTQQVVACIVCLGALHRPCADAWAAEQFLLERVYGTAAAWERRMDRAVLSQVARLPGVPSSHTPVSPLAMRSHTTVMRMGRALAGVSGTQVVEYVCEPHCVTAGKGAPP